MQHAKAIYRCFPFPSGVMWRLQLQNLDFEGVMYVPLQFCVVAPKKYRSSTQPEITMTLKKINENWAFKAPTANKLLGHFLSAQLVQALLKRRPKTQQGTKVKHFWEPIDYDQNIPKSWPMHPLCINTVSCLKSILQVYLIPMRDIAWLMSFIPGQAWSQADAVHVCHTNHALLLSLWGNQELGSFPFIFRQPNCFHKCLDLDLPHPCIPYTPPKRYVEQ